MKKFVQGVISFVTIMIVSSLFFLSCAPQVSIESKNNSTNNENQSSNSEESQQNETTFLIQYETEFGNLPENLSNGINIKEDTFLDSDYLPTLFSEGYAFEGWFDGDIQVIPGKYKVSKTVTLIAKWSVATVSYTITFESEHGTVPSIVTLPEKTLLTETILPVLIEDGYRFEGWYDGETKINVGIDILTKKLNLVAKWTRVFTVSYESKYGEVPNSLILEENTVLTNEELPTLSIDGYVFEGWWDNETLVSSGQYNVIKNVNLKAKWRNVTYTVSFRNRYNQGEKVLDDEIFSVGEEKALTYVILPETSDTVFMYWTDSFGIKYYNGEIVKNLSTSDGATVILWGHFNTYGAAYETKKIGLYEYSVSQHPSEYYQPKCDIEGVQVPNNSKIHQGFTFKSWNTRSDGFGTSYKETEIIPYSQIDSIEGLYAQWEPNKGTIHFYANGGSGTMDDLELRTGDRIPECLFSREYYDLVGWKFVNNEIFNLNKKEYSDYTLYQACWLIDGGEITLQPEWEVQNYTVRFEKNNTNASGIMDYQIIDYWNETSISKNLFINEDFNFIGWNTKADGSGTTYLDEALITNLGDITLYAQWEPIVYTVRFDPNNGDPIDERQFTRTWTYPGKMYDYSGPFHGQHITNWNTKPDGSGKECITNESSWRRVSYYHPRYTFLIEEGTEITLYAQWEPNKYTLVLNGNGGTSEGKNEISKDFVYGDTYQLDTFSREGYSFVNWKYNFNGWQNECSENENIYFTVESFLKGTLDIDRSRSWTLTAQWETIHYDIKFDSTNCSGSMDNIIALKDQDITLPQNTLEREGYTFICWQSGSNYYFEGDTVSNLTNIGNTITLTPVWVNEESAITLNMTLSALRAANAIKRLPDGGTYTLNLTGSCDENIINQIGEKVREKNINLDLHLENTMGLTKISNLSSCLSLKNLYLSVQTIIGKNALSGCNNLASINFTDLNQEQKFITKGFDSNGEQQITLTEKADQSGNIYYQLRGNGKLTTLHYSLGRCLAFLFNGNSICAQFEANEYEWRVGD